MKSVSVALLKAKLSDYLRHAQAGSEVVVTSHRHPVGRLIPYLSQPEIEIRLPSQPITRLAQIKGVSLQRPVDVVKLLRSDRDTQ